MVFHWPAEGTSVILLPHGVEGDKVFELAEEWTRHRLLMPALYIRVENQNPSAYQTFEETGPIEIIALVAGRDGFCEISLFDELGRNEIKLIKLIACRLVESEASFNEQQDQMVDRIREQIERSAPLREEDGQKVIGTKILRLNLIAGESTRVVGATEHLLELDWDANIILSPEDRSTPSGFDTFTDSSDVHYPGFLLSNIASTAGLWTGVNKSVLELHNVESSTTYDKVLVQRTFGRAVKTDTLAIRLASTALRSIEELGSPLADPTYNLIDKQKMQVTEIPSLIQRMVEETLKADNGALSFNLSLERAKAEGTEKMSLKDGLKLFARFFWKKLISLPRHLVDIVFERYNKKATSILFGEDSGYAIEARKDFRKFGLQEQDAEDLIKIDDVKKLVATTLNGLPAAPDYRSQHSDLWTSIRKMMVASLEGSLDGELNEFNGRVLVDTERLIPKFGHVWTVPECVLDPDEDPAEVKSTLDWLDVEEADKILKSIDSDITYLRTTITEHQVELLSGEKEQSDAKTNMKDARTAREKLVSREKSLALILEGVDDGHS